MRPGKWVTPANLLLLPSGYNTTYIGTTNITYNQFLAPAMNFTIRPLEA